MANIGCLNDPEFNDILRRMYALVAEKKLDSAIDVLYALVDDLCLAGRFEEANKVALAVDVSLLEENLATGLLCMVWSCDLECRPVIYERVRARLLELVPDRVDAILKGLGERRQ